MSKYKFSKTSKKRLGSCHHDIQFVMNMAIELSPMDFGIAEGHRSVEVQQEYYSRGRDEDGNIINEDEVITYIDGVTKKGKHNYKPSEAVDIYAWVNDKASWKAKDMIFLAGFISGIAEMLFKQGIISSKFRWGGNWDQDGEILSDQDFDDMPHFEIIDN